jgi:hypothetical protein
MIINSVEMTVEMKDLKYMTTAEINITEWITALELIEIHGSIVLAIHELEIKRRAIIQKRKNIIDMAMHELMEVVR